MDNMKEHEKVFFRDRGKRMYDMHINGVGSSAIGRALNISRSMVDKTLAKIEKNSPRGLYHGIKRD